MWPVVHQGARGRPATLPEGPKLQGDTRETTRTQKRAQEARKDPQRDPRVSPGSSKESKRPRAFSRLVQMGSRTAFFRKTEDKLQQNARSSSSSAAPPTEAAGSTKPSGPVVPKLKIPGTVTFDTSPGTGGTNYVVDVDNDQDSDEEFPEHE